MPPRAPVYHAPRPGKATPREARVKDARASGDVARPHSRARGYDRTWERLRRMHLNNHPFCVMCDARGIARVATVVDHVKTIDERPDLRLDPSNLQSLCKPHHDGTKQRQDRAAKRARDASP